MQTEPRTLFIDIETMSNKIYAWSLYDTSAIDIIEHWYMLSFAWKWMGESKTYVKALPDYPLYKKELHNDRSLIQSVWDLFDKADIIVAHNGNSFDIKKINAIFAKHGMKPPSPYVTIDTKLVAKKYFRFDSNKLDSLADFFKIGRKINTGGFALWKGCEANDGPSWRKMKKYNAYDVVLLEKVYFHMRPFMTDHPNIGLMSGVLHACPVCGSTNIMKRGFRYTRTTKVQRYVCLEDKCGAWSCAPKLTSQVR